MKHTNKKLLTLIIALALVIVLFVPFGYQTYDDGGTQRFTSLTYSVVIWNRFVSDWSTGEMRLDKYENTNFYIFPDNFKSIDELWEIKH